MVDTTAIGYVPLKKDGGTATNLTFTTGSIGTAVTGVTQAPLTGDTTMATTEYVDDAVTAGGGGLSAGQVLSLNMATG